MRYCIGRAAACALLAGAVVVGGCGAPDGSAPVSLGRIGSPSSTPATPSDTVIPTTDPYPASRLIDHTRWTTDADGRRLHVYPTPAGRKDWYAPALDRAWREVLADSPDANTPGMFDQFKCHWQWARMVAPDKPEWNLEPWRPAVGYDATVQALCNPGGPDLPGK